MTSHTHNLPGLFDVQAHSKTLKQLGLSALASLALLPSTAQATLDISLRLDAHFGNNDNLFRVDRQRPTDEAAGSDRGPPVLKSGLQSQSVDIGLGVPLASERTRLILTTSLGRAHISARPDLNHSPQAATAALPWRFTDILEGEVSVGTASTAYPYDDVYARLDTVKRNWTQATVNLAATPTLSFPLEVSRQTLEHRDRIVHGFLDSEQQRASAAVMYRSTTGSTAQWGLARTETRYPARTRTGSDNLRQENDADVFVDVTWAYSAITQFSGRWANRQRKFDGDRSPMRMNLYRLGVSHTFSPLLQLDAQLWRQPVASTQSGVLGGWSTGRRIGLRYAPNEKWDVSAAWLKQSEQNQAANSFPRLIPLNPDTTNFTVRARYNFEPRLSAYLDVDTEKRVRRQTDLASQQVIRLGLEYRFENITGATVRTRAATLTNF